MATDGTIYYTDFGRGYLGHFDPATKKVEEWKSPSGEGSEPYGITVTPAGVVWYSETGVKPNRLVRFDPTTKSFSMTPVPSGGGVIRNMAATRDGKVYLACSGVNKIGIADAHYNKPPKEKIIEVKSAWANKGETLDRLLSEVPDPDFIFAVGDDRTDEGLFEHLPNLAWTVHVGAGPTRSSFVVTDFQSLRRLLELLAKSGNVRHAS